MSSGRSFSALWCVKGLGAVSAAAVLVASVSATPALATTSGFDNPSSSDTSQQFAPGSVQRQDTPNDPVYDQAEPDSGVRHDPNATLSNERFDLFGFPSQLTPGAVYKDGPHAGMPQVSGFNAAGAWKGERGRPDVFVAILDTGIRWDDQALRLQVHLNTAELPLPQINADGATATTYDSNGDGVVNVDDYAHDPRVHKPAPTGEDLINTFGHCQIDPTTHLAVGSTCSGTAHFDNDGNGFANDIAGWDFFNNTNNPVDRSSYFAAHNHGTGRATGAVERGNDLAGSIGVCPKCQFVPVRIYDTFVSDGNDFGLGIVYGTVLGASVIEGSNGSLTHTAFSQAASEFAYQHGVTQTYSGNDLNTGDHNYPANYNHTMEIQGTVPDGGGAADAVLQKLPAALKSQLGLPNTDPSVSTYFRGANTTQFGGHSSVAFEGSTGSENTGKASGAAAMVIAAGKDGPKVALRPDEVRELIEQTAEPVSAANSVGVGVPDPGVANLATDSHFTTHFGWGRADLGAAVAHALKGDIPPDASITSPDWYAPLPGDSVRITGLAQAPVNAPAGAPFTWSLKWGPGLAPATLTEISHGTSTTPVTDFGPLDLAMVRSALANATIPPDSGGPVFAAGAHDPYQDQFSVELDVTYAHSTLTGIDRKVLTAMPPDPMLRAGNPRRLGTGGEAPPRYVDINGDGVQELLVPAEDGQLHAYEPDGSELPGWPFQTPIQSSAVDHQALLVDALHLPPVREPLRGVAVADLDHNGTQEVVVTAGNHVFVLEPDGSVRAGFPVSVNVANCVPAEQSQTSHHPKCGFLASPALGHLVKGDSALDIVAPALDGRVYAWDANGQAIPHFPVQLADPNEPAATRQVTESITNPTLRDLNGDGVDDIVAASNEAYGAAPPTPDDVRGGVSGAFADALSNIGGSSRLYAIDGATGTFLPGWPVKLNGAIQSTLPFIGPGHDSSTLTLSGAPVVVASTTGGVVSEYNADGTLLRGIQQNAFGPGSNATDRSGVFNLFEYASIGDVLGAGRPAVVKYGLTLGQVANLALSGQNVPYNHLIGAYDAGTGAPLPAWPTVTDDYQFLSSSTIAQVVPGGVTQQVIAGTGLGLLHAYDGATGQDVAGFPKVTGGWLFAPAALSDDHRMAAVTREGYLFEWNLDAIGPTCQNQWPGFRHDAHNSGDYNTDGTAPGVPLSLSVSGQKISFASPGDDGYCGQTSAYVVRVDGQVVNASGPVVGPLASAVLTLPAVPAAGTSISVLAVDKAGNTGSAAIVRAPAGATPTPTVTVTASSSPTPTVTASASPSGSSGPTPSASPSLSLSPSPSASSDSATPTPTPSPSPSAASPSASSSPSPSTSPSASPSASVAGLYHPLTPARVLDTRAANVPVVAGADRILHLSGAGGLPESGVSAVVLSVTVPLPQTPGDLEVYPVGSQPTGRVSNVNWPAHRTMANLVTVPLGQGGSVALSVSQGSAHVIADVVGWYGDGTDSGGARYTSVTPARIFDTGSGSGMLRSRVDQRLALRGRGGIPDSSDVTSVVMTVTALGTDGPADLQVYPSGARPTSRTSNLNLVKGQTAAVLVDATLGADGTVGLSLSNSSARILVDVVGYYSSSGSRFVALTPRRIIDRAQVNAGSDRAFAISGSGGVPNDATAVLVNTTGVGASAPLDLEVYPTGRRPPVRTSVLNLEPNQAVADLVASGLNNGGITLSASQGSVLAVLDLAGYFVASPSPGT